MPIGESVPCGVSTNTESPILAPSLAARLAYQNAVPLLIWRGEGVQAPALQGAHDVGDLRLERRVDALDLNRQRILAGGNQPLTEDLGRGADDVRDPDQPVGLGLIVGDPPLFPHVYVRVRADNAIAQFLLESCHQGKRDDDSHDAHGDAQRRDERNHRDERLLPLGEQIPERDVQLEGDVHNRWSTVNS